MENQFIINFHFHRILKEFELHVLNDIDSDYSYELEIGNKNISRKKKSINQKIMKIKLKGD